jgi:hypothetical protein
LALVLKIDHFFGSTTKIDGLTQGIDQRLKIAHIKVLNLNDESNVVLKTQGPPPPRSPNRKTLVFGASNVSPSRNTPHTQTCKLFRVEWKPNKILEKKNMKLDEKLTAIAIAIS